MEEGSIFKFLMACRDNSPHKQASVREGGDFKGGEFQLVVGPSREGVGSFVALYPAMRREPVKGNDPSFLLELVSLRHYFSSECRSPLKFY